MPDIEDGPVTSPVDADIANELASSPTAQGMGPAPDAAAPQTVSAGSSLSYKGSTEHGKKYAAGLFGQAEKASDEFAAQDAARTAADTATMQRDYAGVKQATQGEIGATNEYAGRNQDLLQKKLEFNQLAAAAEERAHLESVAERQKYLANYQEQLAGVRALSMTTGNPIGGMSKGEEFGLMGAQFAEGFLGARYGVHIDVAGQVDRWINRSIQEHQMKIQNARQGAEDQLHLYEIARQNSQDDWEARQRYRGFVIQGLQTQIEMNAGRYQSKLANAQAGVSLAKLQVEADQTARQIGDAHQTRALQEKHMMLDEAYKQGMLGIEQYKAQTQRMEADNKGPKGPNLMPISDIEMGPDGKYKIVGHVDASDKDAMKQIHASQSAGKNLFAALDRLEQARQTAYAKYGSAPLNQRWAANRSEEVRAYERERLNVMQQIRLATTGKVFGEAEAAEYLKRVPVESGWQAGNNDLAIPQLREQVRQDFESKLGAYTFEGQHGMDVKAAPHAASEYRVLTTPEDPNATKVVSVPEAIESGNRVSSKEAVPASKLYTAVEGDAKQPHDTTAVDVLAKIYVDPQHARPAAAQVFGDDERYSLPDHDALLQQQAYDALVKMSKDYARPELANYAQQVVRQLEADPAAIRRVLSESEKKPAPLTGEYTATRLKE